MNMKTLMKKKEVPVIKVLFILILLTSCRVQKKIVNDDYLILNKVINTSTNNDFKIKLSNNNSYIISIVKIFKELQNLKNRLNKEKLSLGIESNKANEYIFNKSQYDYYLSQEKNNKWNFNMTTIVNKENILKEGNLKKLNLRKNEIFISKPIYTLNKKYALVNISKSSIFYIMILHNQNGEWIKIDNIATHIK